MMLVLFCQAQPEFCYQQKHRLLKSCSSRKEEEWLRGRGAAEGRDREERRNGVEREGTL